MEPLLALVAFATVGISAAVGHVLDRFRRRLERKVEDQRRSLEELQEQALPPGWDEPWDEGGVELWQGVQARRAFNNREQGEA